MEVRHSFADANKKDGIIPGGFNICPADLEAVLTDHSAVFESAVIGCVEALGPDAGANQQCIKHRALAMNVSAKGRRL